MTAALRFDPIRLPEKCEQLRKEVRAFLAEEIAAGTFDPHKPNREDTDVPEFSPQGRRARLARHDLAEEIWRPRALVPRALCRDRGDARRQRADAALLRRRPPERPGAAEIRARAHQDGHPAAHLPRRDLLCHRHERAEFRLRPVRGEDPRHQDRRRLSDQRHQDLDLVGAYRRLHDRDLPHLAADQGKPPPRPDAVPGQDEAAGHPGEPDRPDHRPVRIQRGRVHRLFRARRSRARRDRRRLEAGDQRARL